MKQVAWACKLCQNADPGNDLDSFPIHQPVCCLQAFPACAEDEQTLPNLQILAVRHLCTVGHLLNVRCAPDAQPDATESPFFLIGKLGCNMRIARVSSSA